MPYPPAPTCRRGFTLIEIVLAMLLAFLIGVAALGSVIYTRKSLELNKQRLAALNFCRQAMEAAHTNAGITTLATRRLVEFSTDGVEIPAMIEVLLRPISAEGRVVWSTPLTAPPLDRPAYCAVRVNWMPPGSWGRPPRVEMVSIIRAGVK